MSDSESVGGNDDQNSEESNEDLSEIQNAEQNEHQIRYQHEKGEEEEVMLSE